MRAIQYLLERPMLALMTVPVALAIGFFVGQLSVPMRPVEMVKYRPAKKRQIKSIEKTAKAILESELVSIAEEVVKEEQDDPPVPLKKTPLEAIDVSKLSVDELVNHLRVFKPGGKLSQDEVQRNLDVSDELIKREPDLYFAYKLKLKMLLLNEAQFQQEVDEEEYEALYQQLLSFEGESEIDELLASSSGESDAPIDTVTSKELDGIDPELIHAPFLRFSAMGDLEGLAEVAEEYIDEYPESYLGYLYLAEAYWRGGDEAEAVSILKNGLGPASSDEVAAQLFSLLKSSTLERIEKLSVR